MALNCKTKEYEFVASFLQEAAGSSSALSGFLFHQWPVMAISLLRLMHVCINMHKQTIQALKFNKNTNGL